MVKWKAWVKQTDGEKGGGRERMKSYALGHYGGMLIWLVHNSDLAVWNWSLAGPMTAICLCVCLSLTRTCAHAHTHTLTHSLIHSKIVTWFKHIYQNAHTEGVCILECVGMFETHTNTQTHKPCVWFMSSLCQQDGMSQHVMMHYLFLTSMSLYSRVLYSLGQTTELFPPGSAAVWFVSNLLMSECRGSRRAATCSSREEKIKNFIPLFSCLYLTQYPC